MAEGKKSRKAGRSKRNGQALKYKNEFRAEQNKLRRLKTHIKRNGVTGEDVIDAVIRYQGMLGHTFSALKVNESKQSNASLAWYKIHPNHTEIRKQMRDASKLAA